MFHALTPHVRQRNVRGDGHRNTVHARSFLAVLAGTGSPRLPWPEDLPRS
ncbi:hypothetical protein ACTG9Q_23655 [Actinokineospora sp. 24-640]